MNLLNMIPGLNKVLNNNKNLEYDKKEIAENLAQLGVEGFKETLAQSQQSLGTSSLFVSGAIPSLLWMMVFIIFFNYIITPILISFGLQIPMIELPKWYSDLCSTIALGLFAKKAWDSTDMKVGTFQKKSKYESELQTDINKGEKLIELEERCEGKDTEPKKELVTLNPFDIDGANNDAANNNYDENDDVEPDKKYDDPNYINKRLDQMVKKIEKGK